MRHWLVFAAVLFSLAPVRAAQPSLTPSQALIREFTSSEQILLAGVLADPSAAREFAQDAASPATQAVFDKWRQRVALYSRQYLAAQPPLNESARSVKDMVSPAEWEMLMTSLRMLSEGGITDQAKFRIFLAMLDNADSDLAADPPDTRNAHKVVNLGRSKVEDAMKSYLASPTGRAALAEALRRQAAPPPVAKAPAQAAPRTAARPKPQAKAMAQAQAVDQEMRIAAVEEDPDDTAGRNFDGNDSKPSEKASVSGSQSTDATPPPPTLPASGMSLSRPDLVAHLDVSVAPPAPKDDLAELHQRTKKVSGHKKWFVALGLGLLGAAAGLLIGGPIGAAAGAATGAVAGHRLGHYLWG